MPKRDLVFVKPILNAAGTLGFAPDARLPIPWEELGAFITNPISRRPRLPTQEPKLVEFPGGFLLHTGLPNPGFHSCLNHFSRAWIQSRLPIIVHLMADRPDETREMVAALEGVDNILAVELGFAPLLADDLILLAVEMSIGELPVIVNLPTEQLLRLGPRLLESGVSAFSLAAPRGALDYAGAIVNGRLLGPSLFPLSLQSVQAGTKLGLPLIGSNGIFSEASAHLMLEAGAMAVEVDARLWLPTEKEKSPVA
jgi:dihydroorotate dehydrogenase